MYIALYNEEQKHVANVTYATYELTERVYDADGFSAEGVCEDTTTDTKIAVLNDDAGNYKYACFTDGITVDGNKQTVKGKDLKTLWDTEVLLDWTTSFNGKLSAIFQKVKTAVFDGADTAVNKIPVEVIIPTDNTVTTALFGDYTGQYKITNAYKFLKGYLKYYGYNIETKYDVAAGKIIFTFAKHTDALSVNLSDFLYELTTTSNAVNKAVATIKRSLGSASQTVYYYINSDNQIVSSTAAGNIQKRVYPVKTKWFEAEYLADAQTDAISELANNRYVDNIVIDNSKVRDPIDFAPYPLYTSVSLYYNGKLYKTLPISEKTTTLSASGEQTKIKLGFKKILLTEIIKG